MTAPLRLGTPTHAAELSAESARLHGFFTGTPGLDALRWRRTDGSIDRLRPIPLYSTARLAHAHLLGDALGYREAREHADAAIDALLHRHLDVASGAFVDELSADGTARPGPFGAYGHAFVLLAGASALERGHPEGRRLFDAAAAAIDRWFWDEAVGAAVDVVDETGAPGAYRGQNANMHLAEAFLSAFEATADRQWLDRAARLARRFVLDVAPRFGWRVPEHYTAQWEVDALFGVEAPDDPFRPFGTLPGHALEWARLLCWLASYDERPTVWIEAAEQLFERAVDDGWDAACGGLVYSADFDGATVNPHRMHWTLAEGLGAAAMLWTVTGDARYAEWYEEFWRFTWTHVRDEAGGSWWHELDEQNQPSRTTWDGKPDLYHAAQATLIARMERPQGVMHALRTGVISAR